MPDFEPFERVLLTIEYDGSAFYGWQRQARLRSVQEELERALARATGRETTVWGASRTDAGVNATGQRAHFHNYSTIPAEKFPFVLNTMLPPDVRVTAARVVPEWLHARFSCRGKIYTYRIHNARHASAIRRNWTTHIPVPMDEGKMAGRQRCGCWARTISEPFKPRAARPNPPSARCMISASPARATI